MARLNDFAAPSESVEALKRRFVRQNREIARVNSMQSLRIRSLESEVSHLLAENVSLREQVITLTHDIERLEAAKMLHDGVYEIKSRLDAKLAELNDLASDLGMLPRKVGKLGGEKLGAEPDRPKATAPESRSRMTDSEYNAAVEEGKLPAILEDKYYPRRTLEPREIQNLVQADSDLSKSPHVIHLTHDDAQVGVAEPSPERNEILPESRIDRDTPCPGPFLPPTLETRKKKKRADLSDAPGDSTAQTEQSDSKVETAQPVISGSKRKFSPDDDGFLADLAPEDDEFQFSRPSRSPQKQSDPFEFMRQDLSPSTTPMTMKRGSANHGITKRKVLEPKSANTNLGSPQKARAALHPAPKMSQRIGVDENTKSPLKPKEIASHKTKSLSQKSRARSTPTLSKQKRSSQSTGYEEVVHNQSMSIQLKDSPVAKSEEGLTGISDMTAASRPSRRQRAVVSYAEPNLRDKMRRPTSELIDAVGGRRSSSFQLLRESLSDEGDRSGNTVDSPRPSSNGNVPADLALADQDTDVFSKDDHSDQLLATMSRRRQSRRHSSNPQSTTRNASPQRGTDAGGRSRSPAAFMQMDGTGSDEPTGWTASATLDATYRRETRVAARRKSMMV